MNPYTKIRVIAVTEAEFESDSNKYLDLLCKHQNTIVLQKDGSFSGLFYNTEAKFGEKRTYRISGKIEE
ncbi:hypothetical protein ACNQGP_16495 [Flavobacterium sp. GT2N3]|uniref:hypothetical protein n=1 Tax=unclassified Flavobacterium TaxID=196869 RepID=UPI003AAC65C5